MKVVFERFLGGRNARLLVCSLIYQAVWFAAVYSASRSSLLLLGPAVLLVGLALQLVLWRSLFSRAVLMLLAASLAGVMIDGALTLAGVLVPYRQVLPYPFPPLWLLTLWAGFGVYMATGLELMYGRPRLAVVAGFICGPLAYRGGVPFGALELGENTWVSLAVIGLVWAIAFPLLLALAARLANGGGPSAEPRVPRVALMLLLLGMLFPASDALALEGDSSLFAPVQKLHDVELARQGVGRLRRWMIKGCDIALYAPPGTTRQSLFDGRAKALEFVYYVRIAGDQFAFASDETLKAELSSETYTRFKAQIDEMGSFFTAVEPGDRYLLYFVPGQGTALDLNGKRRGLIPGDEFADVYFRIWLGGKPLDKALYKGMTGTMR
jgi:hypothetical protein